MSGRNYRLASSELYVLIMKKRSLVLVSISSLIGILVVTSHNIQKHFIWVQIKEYLVFTDPLIIVASLIAYSTIMFSLSHISPPEKESFGLNKSRINHFLYMKNSIGSNISTTYVQIEAQMQKLVHGIEQTFRKSLDIRKSLDLITVTTHDIVFATDDMGKTEYVNKNFLDNSGFVEDEIVGKYMNPLLSPHEGCLFRLEQNDTQNNYNDKLDADMLLKTVAEKRVAVRYGHVGLYAPKELVCVIKNAQEVQKIDEIKNNIISNLSHELLTPLTIVKGFIEIASEEENREKRNKYLQKSLEAVRRQEWIIEDLLEVAMKEEGIKQREYDRVQLYDVVKKAVEKVTPKALEADIKIKNMIKHGICVKADPDKLCYAMIKLLDNAVKFNRPGEDVIIKATASEELITVEVKDRGIGIAPEDLNKVFDHFYQKDASSKRRYGGNGLGLTVAKDIIEQHGGKIWVESKKDKGSTFFFTLHVFTRKAIRHPQHELPLKNIGDRRDPSLCQSSNFKI